MTARKANRNGVLAYRNAPPRLRASQIERPTVIGQPRIGLLRRVFGIWRT